MRGLCSLVSRVVARCSAVSVASGAMLAGACANAQPTPSLVVDQFGYAPDAVKIVVVREPVVGYDAPAGQTPGTTIEVLRADTGTVVTTVQAVAWNGGATHGVSGDRAWWADVSEVRVPGTYVARDPSTGATSARFRVLPRPYRAAARAAARMYYYQRCGVPKHAEHAGASWVDTACHTDDAQSRWIVDPNGSTPMDLTGGWHDAGDFNKYVNFADDVIHELLDAYGIAPWLWTDDFGIPESGNGVPDLLDEVACELRWLMKMQLADGSVLHKVSSANYDSGSPPSADPAVRYYARATPTATMSLCGVFAHAAEVYGAFDEPLCQAFAAELRSRALLAWQWIEAHPERWTEVYDNDGGRFASTDAEDDQYARNVNRVRAALHLYRLTGDAAYRDVFDAGYRDVHLFAWYTMIPYEHVWHEMLLKYTVTPGATPSVVSDIRQMVTNALGGSSLLGAYEGEEDAYRAWLNERDYVWGSNRVRAHTGSTLAFGYRYGLVDEPTARVCRDAAAGYLHALHGVNPQGVAFLTNMGGVGIDRSVNEMYHGWFADGTDWDNAETSLYGPPPGFVTGGPNPHYAHATGGVLEPPMNQPVLKSYRDWNADWPEASWQVTEPHIPYQSAYIRLVAEVSAAAQPARPSKRLHTDPASTLDGRTKGREEGGRGVGSADREP